MSDNPHWIVPCAATHASGCAQAWRALRLPQLQRLLARLAPQSADDGDETAPEPPHERVLARALGLPTPATPWAAWSQRDTGSAWAFITPCHWQVGADQVRLDDPAALALTEPESRALLGLLAPWFAQDGITLHYDQPTRWRAQGDVFDGLHTAAPERAMGRDVRPWLPTGPGARSVQRLHSEMQMLLYTHAFNDARAARGAAPVNALWVHGAGRLAHLPAPPATPPQLLAELQAPALREDWPAWAAAWRALDAGPLAAALCHVQAGGAATLTLCGERNAHTWHSAPRGLAHKLKDLFAPPRLPDLPNQL